MHLSAVVLVSSALSLLLLSSKTQHGAVHAQVSVPGRFQANYAGSLTVNSNNINKEDAWVDRIFDRYPLYHHSRRTHRRENEAIPVLKLPAMDNVGLLNQEVDSQDGSYRFGKAITLESFTATDTLSSGRWVSLKDLKRLQARSGNDQEEQEEDDDVLVWQLEIHSPSALSLNLIFSEFQLPSGTEFFVSGQRHILGAFTAEINNKADKIFATAPVAGDRLLLEFFTPRRILEQEGQRPLIQLSHVIHGYKPMLLAASSDSMNQGFRTRDGSIVPRKPSRGPRRQGFSFQSEEEEDRFEAVPSPPRAMSGKCNVDVACHLHDFQDQSRSVGVILSEYNQKYCTGALINNARQDGRQLFLTANHCAGFADTSEHLVMFNHEKIQCGSSREEVNEHDTAQGLLKLGNYAPSDYTLYEILEPIPDAYNLYLSGWSAVPQAPSSRLRNDEPSEEEYSSQRKPTASSRLSVDPIVGIHHPSGDSKKISFYTNGTLPRACWSECAPEEYFHWQIPRWTEGTTEPGSSGSPLFDADKRIVGQLHGGSASCWNPAGYDAYGGLHASFQTPPKIKNRLATYLDPDSTGAKTLDGYSLEAARRQHSSRRADDEREEEEVMVRVGPLGGFSLEKPFMEDEEDHPQRSGRPSYRHPRHPIQKGEPPRLFRLKSSTPTEDLAPKVIASLSHVWGRLFHGRVRIQVQEYSLEPALEDESDY